MHLRAAPGEDLTADAARRLANRILANVAHGKDPQSELSTKRKKMTVSKLCELYMAEGVETKKSAPSKQTRGG
jgi:hypothetical protein